MPPSISCFSRTSMMTGLGDCRDSSRGRTSGTLDRASLSSSVLVFMVGILTHVALRQGDLSALRLLHIVSTRRGDARKAAWFHPAPRGAADARPAGGGGVHLRHPDGPRAGPAARELWHVQAGLVAFDPPRASPAARTQPEPGLLRAARARAEAALGIARARADDGPRSGRRRPAAGLGAARRLGVPQPRARGGDAVRRRLHRAAPRGIVLRPRIDGARADSRQRRGPPFDHALMTGATVAPFTLTQVSLAPFSRVSAVPSRKGAAY